jgi:hypothetical protein
LTSKNGIASRNGASIDCAVDRDKLTSTNIQTNVGCAVGIVVARRLGSNKTMTRRRSKHNVEIASIHINNTRVTAINNRALQKNNNCKNENNSNFSFLPHLINTKTILAISDWVGARIITTSSAFCRIERI